MFLNALYGSKKNMNLSRFSQAKPIQFAKKEL